MLVSPAMKYHCDPDRFAVDPVDGETIVMDLVDGRLFLLEGGAAVVWDLLADGVTSDALLETARECYGTAVHDEVHAFIADLVARGLLVGIAAGAGEAGEGATAGIVELPPTLGELHITEYDDMTSIITMDPIHDVDPSRGWPFDAAAETPS